MMSEEGLRHTPYDLMVGTWFGTFALFSKRGNRLSGGASRYVVYWKNRPSLLHYRQDQNLRQRGLFDTAPDEVSLRDYLQEHFGGYAADAALRDLAFPDYDLHINGKQATGNGMGPGGSPVEVSGVETTPDFYHFELKETGSGMRWYNTHSFPHANERHTVGPVVASSGLLGLIMVHSFTRVSYDIPQGLRHELGEKSSENVVPQ
jgi:hypothetical protein